MSIENGNLSPERDDPFSFLFAHEKSQTDIKEDTSPKENYEVMNTYTHSEEMTKLDSINVYSKDKYKYEYGYTILLNNPNEEGLIDDYLNGIK